MAKSSNGSLTSKTYTLLRAEILTGRYSPGQPLRPAQLAAEYGIGLNAVREALSRLAGERLVRVAPQQGFTVNSLSSGDLVDITEIRSMLESTALRRSLENGSLAWETGVVASYHELAGTPMTMQDGSEELNIDWYNAHNTFHAATMAGCGSPFLIQLTSVLEENVASMIYGHWAELYSNSDRSRATEEEHEAIYKAVMARDADLAVELNEMHNKSIIKIITNVLGETLKQTDSK